MPLVRIGTCGNCGGDVMSWEGGWFGIQKPPGPQCSQCMAVPKGKDDTIQMEPRRTIRPPIDDTKITSILP